MIFRKTILLSCAIVDLAVLGLAVASGAMAAEGSARPGQSGAVAQHYHLIGTGCRSGALPVIRVRQAPRLGKLAFRTRTIAVPPGGFFSSTPAACVGRPVRATIAVYSAGRTPGHDSFSYDFSFPQVPGSARTKQIGVTIR